jgi:trehalose-phosphatase
LVLAFDYDGTLVPIAPRPELAALPPSVWALLGALAARPRMAVAVLSGRGIDDLKAMVGLPGLLYAGTSGLELDLRDERPVAEGAELARAPLAEAARRLEEAAARCPGAWVERKPLGAALHYRQAPEAEVPALLAAARRALEPFAGGLWVLDAPRALEVTPALGWTKGTALKRIVAAASGAGGALLYAGDEANDADALEAAVELGGLAIGVGERAPEAARHRLPDPPALWSVLEDILRRLA